MKVFYSKTLATMALIATTAGCGVLHSIDAERKDYDSPPGKNDVTMKQFEDDDFLVELANRYGLMALFAETVYRGELNEDVRDEQGCKYLDHGWNGQAQYGMPRVPNSASGWERWIPTEPGESPCMKDSNGLFYETYVYRDENGTIEEAVIAFRGTENRKGQAVPDWITNASAPFGFEPAQYKTAREHIPALIERLTNATKGNSQIKIYAVGHSLGGGLAQQAGHLSNDVLEVFTFNTSPVTNWTYLRRNGLVKQGYPIVHRLYHGGEALETARFVTTSATTASYGRHEIGVQFGEREFAKGHSMKILACNFGRILSRKKLQSGSHHYPSAFIDLNVLKLEDAAAVPGISGMPRRICDDDSPMQGHGS
ncbi:DUF6792 domain-containing protein [Duganella sp. S19_KUP01_CR8]|uniref:DUF6792 domain-containing protein n=1 Tax=Duganella sp. S19_KUP01_CR8 TaxID=3025502 RepID=UPI002FCD8878